MTEDRRDAGDRSLGRSAGAAGLRGVGLLAGAVALAVVLLNASDAGEPGRALPVATETEAASGPATSVSEAPAEAPPTSGAPVPPASTSAARPRREVKVLAANATGVGGAGGRVRDRLARAEFDALAPTNAAPQDPPAATAVYFAPGYEAEARDVAAALELAPPVVAALASPPPVADLRGANVVVVVGPDLAGTPPSSAPGSASSSSAPASTGAASSTTAP